MLSFVNETGDRSVAELTDFVRAARGLLADALCGRIPARKIPRRELLRLVSLMDRAEEYLRFNVSPKHVLGMIMVNMFPNDKEKTF